jgi:LacI family transcriptional regulator
MVEITREFGRDLCKGIAAFAGEREDVSPVFITPDMLKRKSGLARFDGFIVRVMNGAMARTLAATRKPVVDVYYERPYDGFAIVKTNHAKVGQLAAAHFIAHQFKNFAFCGFAGGRFSDYCRQAFANALKRGGFSCRNYTPAAKTRYEFDPTVLINERMEPAPDAKALEEWLRSLALPVAVFCPNDLRAWQLLQVCRDAGFRVPYDVAILGLDNDALICGFSKPAISSIDPDTVAIGREAMRTICEMTDRHDDPRRQIVRQVPPKGVVVRTSTETYPVDPPWLSDALVFIRRHVADRLSAADIYARTGLSHTVVDKTFRKRLGRSVQKEIAAARLEKAQHMLATGNASVTEIANASGFASTEYFIRAFNAGFGISPSKWRASVGER